MLLATWPRIIWSSILQYGKYQEKKQEQTRGSNQDRILLIIGLSILQNLLEISSREAYVRQKWEDEIQTMQNNAQSHHCQWSVEADVSHFQECFSVSDWILGNNSSDLREEKCVGTAHKLHGYCCRGKGVGFSIPYYSLVIPHALSWAHLITFTCLLVLLTHNKTGFTLDWFMITGNLLTVWPQFNLCIYTL